MFTTRSVWIACPHGFTGPPTDRRLRLAVAVSLRLGSDAPAQDDPGGGPVTLSSFPPALDWPTTLAGLQFGVEVDGSTPAPATVVSTADPALWQLLFPASARVELHRVDDLTGRAVSTYPNATVAATLRTGYPTVFGSSPIEPPRHAVLAQAFPELAAASGSRADDTSTATAQALLAAEDAATDPATRAAAHVGLARTLLAGSGAHSRDDRLAATIRLAQRLARDAGPAYTPVVPAEAGPVSALTQLLAFHRGPAVLAPGGSDGGSNPTPAAPQLDVHQAMSALADHPELLPLFGLVVELELPVSAVPPSPPSAPPRRLRVLVSGADGAPTPLSALAARPWTAYTLDGDTAFTAAAAPGQTPETVAGLLNLADPAGYELIQIDVDSGALKTLAALPPPTTTGTDPTDSTDATGLPTVRTAGVSLSRLGQGSSLQARFAAALAADATLAADPGSLTLFDVDVTRGYRIDVRDDSDGVWRSLHRRHGTYLFTAADGAAPAATVELDGEGFAQPAVVHHADPGPLPAPLYVHESLAHWQGWSLSVTRPGAAVGDTGPAAPPTPAPIDGFTLATRFTVPPGTLPRLRFGHAYRLRARAVDVAGNSLGVEEATAVTQALATLGRAVPVLPSPDHGLTYRRFEPVPAPTLVLRERPAEGESVHRLVLRSSPTEDTEQCTARLRAATAARPDATGTGYLPVAERHVVPPKISLSAAETTGMLDAAFGAAGAPDPAYLVALRDGGLDDTTVVDPASGLPQPIPDTTGTDPRTGTVVTRPSVQPAGTGANTAVVHHEDALTLPYLPDPLSRGAVLFGLPGLAADQAALLTDTGDLVVTANPLRPSTDLPAADLSVLGSMTQIGFGPAWPGRVPFRLRLAEAPGDQSAPPVWDGTARVLTVFLPKAEQVQLRLSSVLDTADVDTLGQWGWLVASLTASTPGRGLDAEALQLAAAGALWMLTPATPVTLVHAVQQPLRPPQITGLTAVRGPGDLGTLLGGTIAVHGRSSAKIDLLAAWTETVDDPAEPGYRTVAAEQHVFEVPIHLPDDVAAAGPVPAPTTQPIASYDAAHDVLTLVAPASAPAPGTSAGAATGASVGPRPDVAPRPNGNGNGGPGPKPVPPPLPYTSRQDFADTRHRQLRYTAVATSRFRDYFPHEVTDPTDATTATGDPYPVSVPSSARPVAPRVLACIPTAAWDRPAGTFGVRTRRSGSLRVLLDRPWFSSGDGELLGVVLATPDRYPPDDGSRPYLSHWGRDPIWAGAPVPALSAASFRTADPGAEDVAASLPELAAATGNGAVRVAGHAVTFDPDRRLWYADIGLDTGASYRPLVRLAVARYQPDSLPGLELSPVVPCDLVQLLPDRTVTTTPDPADPDHILLRVDGPSFTAGSWPGLPELPEDAFDVIGIAPVPDLVEVGVEQRLPGGTDEAGWRPAPADLPVAVRIDTAAAATGVTDPTQPLWQGSVVLPAGRLPGQLRIVVREREHLLTGRLQNYSYKEDVPDLPHGPGIVTTHSSYNPGEGRVVYVETIPV